jgi:ribulose-5-phosphate 4-epimerase/fuculose-1-phosphate aldolase
LYPAVYNKGDLVPNYNTRIASIEHKVSAEEWQARVDLAAFYRLVDIWGMSDLIANHISVRVPGEPNHFLINSYGYLYEEITASSLIKIDLDGNIVWKPDFDYGFNRAGFVIHSAVHRARDDAHCIVHTHSEAGMAISALECGLLPITQMAMRFAQVAYHDFEGVVVDLGEQDRLVRDLGKGDLMILRNHGLLAVGASIPETFDTIRRAELACATQLKAMASGAPLVIPSAEIQRETARLYEPRVRRPFGILEWPALLRKLDRIDPTYRH